MKWRCTAAIPLPPKKSVEEHAATQEEFLATTLEPLLASARHGDGHVFSVDAVHFVQGEFLCCRWCVQRLFIRGVSGRKRYSVLEAWNALTNQLVSITTCETVSSETMCDLLRKIAALGLHGPVTLVLHARYQHCAVVMNLAATLHIRLQFLPSYSPNLNLIERLWKFIKRDVLYGKHYDDFATFCRAIDDCLESIPTTHKSKLASLMTHNFQRFNIASFLTA
jgi:transposase